MVFHLNISRSRKASFSCTLISVPGFLSLRRNRKNGRAVWGKPGQSGASSWEGFGELGPPDQRGSPKQCGILQGCVRGGAVGIRLCWETEALWPCSRVSGSWRLPCASILPCPSCLPGEQQPELSDHGLCQPHQPLLPQETALRNAELRNFGVL